MRFIIAIFISLKILFANQPVLIITDSTATISESTTENSIYAPAGWNLLGVTQDATCKDFFQSATEIIWQYNSSWSQCNLLNATTTISAGSGFWLKNAETRYIAFPKAASTNTLSLVKGWNLISPLADTTLQDIQSQCSISSAWKYINNLFGASWSSSADITTVAINRGYWLNTNAPCDLSFDTSSTQDETPSSDVNMNYDYEVLFVDAPQLPGDIMLRATANDTSYQDFDVMYTLKKDSNGNINGFANIYFAFEDNSWALIQMGESGYPEYLIDSKDNFFRFDHFTDSSFTLVKLASDLETPISTTQISYTSQAYRGLVSFVSKVVTFQFSEIKTKDLIGAGMDIASLVGCAAPEVASSVIGCTSFVGSVMHDVAEVIGDDAKTFDQAQSALLSSAQVPFCAESIALAAVHRPLIVQALSQCSDAIFTALTPKFELDDFIGDTIDTYLIPKDSSVQKSWNPQVECASDEKYSFEEKMCVWKTCKDDKFECPTCSDTQELVYDEWGLGECEDICKNEETICQTGYEAIDCKCVAITCQSDEKLVGNECVAKTCEDDGYNCPDEPEDTTPNITLSGDNIINSGESSILITNITATMNGTLNISDVGNVSFNNMIVNYGTGATTGSMCVSGQCQSINTNEGALISFPITLPTGEVQSIPKTQYTSMGTSGSITVTYTFYTSSGQISATSTINF